MFGYEIDYHLLRPFTHRHGFATRAELEAAADAADFSIEEADAYLTRARETLFRGGLLIDPRLSYLDIGCGMGRLSLGLAASGVGDVTGIDILERNIVEAKRLARKILPTSQQPRFVHADIHDWKPPQQYDVIIALGALEHIHDQEQFLAALPKYLKSTGRCFVSIEPFHSPLGDHMRHFFRFPIPWMGLLFNERAVLRLRREMFRPDDHAETYLDIEGGLNQVRYGTYLTNIERAGLKIHRNHINPQLSTKWTWRLLGLPMRFLTNIPLIRDYFIVTDYAELRHAEHASTTKLEEH